MAGPRNGYNRLNHNFNLESQPITSVLIANRGEIALRVGRTASDLGVRCTTIYTDPDAHSQHALSSPFAVNLGAPSAYLDGERIIKAAKENGCEALHPGYGFLSENSAFAKRCVEEGLVFIGPPWKAIEAMGNKSRSKEIMIAAGVPCIPGYHGANQDPKYLLEEAKKIGFPVMVKAVKGGGGKGMRIAMTPDEFLDKLESAKSEGRNSFGDDEMLVEKYIATPRHIEVQVFADKFGNAVALGERDCSLQRRHQKILEEAPAPNLEEGIRQELWEKARAAALAVGYEGAGTVEFIFDNDTNDVRIDAGFIEGDTVSSAYDGMIAKLIVSGPTREVALRKMYAALQDYEVVGLSTNIEFLKRICKSPDFIKGEVETGYIQKHHDELFTPEITKPETFIQAALGILAQEQSLKPTSSGPHGLLIGYGSPDSRTFSFVVGNTDATSKPDPTTVTTTQLAPNLYNITLTSPSSEPIIYTNITTTSTPKSITTFYPHTRLTTTLIPTPSPPSSLPGSKTLTLFQTGTSTTLTLLPPAWHASALNLKAAANTVLAPMPCKILRHEVAEGDSVEVGQALLVIESMKMETVIRAPKAGMVRRLVGVGEICGAGRMLVGFVEEEE
ncbi:putative Methylcrotonoyl-CoA carboxylase subunit alpha, mitochondrial [Glarea lozoyensis 74030]|uniref:Putative Methylcrotonoyl-CoA carboxylase subunit alpha, mitochondrial n=1 Tax=Glarea lozoyensis (strain ATCC 74030 / MF5533) TaxID=1104152 RepID=H0EQV9_GLAL7|nr:putative Methylcrotonoyl-CoA carboxylase subunit alpha, mitochondrial [Glarea lozoyensis 74030]